MLTPTGRAEARVPALPRSQGKRVELFISSGCNLHCSFCCESERIQRKEWMPWERLIGWLDRAAASGCRMIQFMGGEATLHPRFPDALREAKARGLSTFVITNLLRWEDPAFAEAVAPWLDEVMVSMHAGSADSGALITGRPAWHARFLRARDEAARTLGPAGGPGRRARVRASTVLTRASAPELSLIYEALRPLRPERWILGNAVPVEGSRADPMDTAAPTGDLTIPELRALQPALRALSAQCAADGCGLVLFCFPHCVLGPELWDQAHDFFVENQDLSPDAPAEARDVNFWSEAEYHETPRPVTLARSRPPICAGCARETVCGGHFTEQLRRAGSGGLEPIRGAPPAEKS